MFILDDLHNEITPILSIHQTCFIGKIGTEVNLQNLLEKCIKLKNVQSKGIFILFVDIKAAYDLVNHKILINKLKNKKIDETLINVIKIIYSNAKNCDILYMGKLISIDVFFKVYTVSFIV